MKTIEAISYKQRLDGLFDRGLTFSDEIEIQSHWAKYLCILVAGFIETSVCAIYSQYAKKKAAPYVANYACSRLAKFSNPKMEDIYQLAGLFSQTWRKKLEEATSEEIKDAVDSTVANRNLIAHGRDVGITYARVKSYYGRVVKMVELVEATVLEGL